MRLTTAGAVDTTFGTGGLLTFEFPGQSLTVGPNTLKVNADDGIVVVVQNQNVENSMVMKATAAGAPDATFGDASTPGILTVSQIVPGQAITLTAVDADPDRIVTVGGSGPELCAVAFKQEATNEIAITSPQDSTTLTANQFAIYGTSTMSDAAVHVLIDAVPVDVVVVTDSRGQWSLGVTEPLTWSAAPGTSHTVTANLIYDLNTVVATNAATVNLQTP
jgi:hypothetical protein